MPENWKLANAAIIIDMMRQRDVAALDAKYTKELAEVIKPKMMLCAYAAAGRRRVAYQSSLSVSA